MEADTQGPGPQLGTETGALLPHSAESHGPGMWWGWGQMESPRLHLCEHPRLPLCSCPLLPTLLTVVRWVLPSAGRPACLPACLPRARQQREARDCVSLGLLCAHGG